VLAGAAIGRYTRRFAGIAREFNSLCRALPWLIVLLVVSVPYEGSMQVFAAARAVGAFCAGLTVASAIASDPQLDWHAVGERLFPMAVSRGLAIAGLAVLAHATLGFLGMDQEPGASFGRDLIQAFQTFPIHYAIMAGISVWLGMILFGCYLGRESLRTAGRMPGHRDLPIEFGSRPPRTAPEGSSD
jgi:uncharacterized RDD family membrane protein YckC